MKHTEKLNMQVSASFIATLRGVGTGPAGPVLAGPLFIKH